MNWPLPKLNPKSRQCRGVVFLFYRGFIRVPSPHSPVANAIFFSGRRLRARWFRKAKDLVNPPSVNPPRPWRFFFFLAYAQQARTKLTNARNCWNSRSTRLTGHTRRCWQEPIKRCGSWPSTSDSRTCRSSSHGSWTSAITGRWRATINRSWRKSTANDRC